MALVINRFQVMSNYARQVMKSVYKEEVRRTEDGILRFQLKRARKLLTRDNFLMDPTSQKNLAAALSRHQTLDTVYEFRQRLEGIWQKTTDSQEQLLIALQEWCSQAEATGIKALQEFSQSLKSYSLQPQMV
jgi:stearoyl-CoA desaturase (delta-9 desaturase)